MIYKGTLATAARLQQLTQHIYWPHGSINGDHLAQLKNYMDTTLTLLGHHLGLLLSLTDPRPPIP